MLRMLSYWVMWVCTLWVTGHEFAFHRLQMRRWSLCRNGLSTRELFSRSERGSCACNHWSVPFGDGLLPIADDPEVTRDQVTGMVKRTRLMPQCSHICTPALVRTWFWTLSLATTVILLRSGVRATSLRLSWLHCTTSYRFDPLRWFADFAMEERWLSSDAVHQHFQGLILVHHWDVRPDTELCGCQQRLGQCELV